MPISASFRDSAEILSLNGLTFGETKRKMKIPSTNKMRAEAMSYSQTAWQPRMVSGIQPKDLRVAFQEGAKWAQNQIEKINEAVPNGDRQHVKQSLLFAITICPSGVTHAHIQRSLDILNGEG